MLKQNRYQGSKSLPQDIRRVIIRKLRYQRRNIEMQCVSVNQTVYSKLCKEILADIQARKLGRSISLTSLMLYHEIVANVTTVTKEWPGTVWKTISDILEKAHVVADDSKELNAILDKFSWAEGQSPFTIALINPESFRGIVIRQAGRYGLSTDDDISTSFNRQLGIAAAAAQCGILNTARQARGKIGIAIDEYQIEQLTKTSSTAVVGYTPNTARREVRKQETMTMYKKWQKKYQELKNKCPNKSDVWYSINIAKLDIAKGRSAGTIKKNMK